MLSSLGDVRLHLRGLSNQPNALGPESSEVGFVVVLQRSTWPMPTATRSTPPHRRNLTTGFTTATRSEPGYVDIDRQRAINEFRKTIHDCGFDEHPDELTVSIAGRHLDPKARFRVGSNNDSFTRAGAHQLDQHSLELGSRCRWPPKRASLVG